MTGEESGHFLFAFFFSRVRIGDRKEDSMPLTKNGQRVPAGARNDGMMGEDDDAVAAYLRSVGEYALLPPLETVRLCKEYKRTKNQKVREKIILHNLRFVISIAKSYVGRGLSFLELIQEGNIGLMRAVERFKPVLGYLLTTYARWWIRQSITRSLANQGRTIRIPIHALDRRRRVFRATDELAEELGRAPSMAEIAATSGEDERFVVQSFNLAYTVPLGAPLSFDDDGVGTLGDTIPDEQAAKSWAGADHSTLLQCLAQALSTLTDREQNVLKCRFGFVGDGRELTLEEVGKKHGVTRERIRQIEAKALRKLRTPSRLRLLQGSCERALR